MIQVFDSVRALMQTGLIGHGRDTRVLSEIMIICGSSNILFKSPSSDSSIRNYDERDTLSGNRLPWRVHSTRETQVFLYSDFKGVHKSNKLVLGRNDNM